MKGHIDQFQKQTNNAGELTKSNSGATVLPA
jgi:hypothetical protein